MKGCFPQGTIGNALAVIIELLSANLGAGDPRLRSEPPGKRDLVLSCPVLSCPVLSCLVLSCLERI
jgi:hypothetical protein